MQNYQQAAVEPAGREPNLLDHGQALNENLIDINIRLKHILTRVAGPQPTALPTGQKESVEPPANLRRQVSTALDLTTDIRATLCDIEAHIC